jgi:hypothetical protein
VKREVVICLAIVCAALLVNAGTRYYAAHREQPAGPPVIAVPGRAPETVPTAPAPAPR